MLHFKTIIFTLLLLPIMAHATPMRCLQYDFLKNGFSMNNYNQCRSIMKKCPSHGALPDISCVDKVVSENKVCSQLHQLAQVTQGVLDLIIIEENGHFLLVDQLFPADGQNHYYIISPKNCVIDTQIDPRELSASLKNKYKSTQFMMTNWQKPLFQTQSNGSHNANVMLKVTDTCLACKRIGYATLNFDFDQAGQLTKVNLEKFSQNDA